MITISTLTSVFSKNWCQQTNIIYDYSTTFLLTLILSKTDVNVAMLKPFFLVVIVYLRNMSMILIIKLDKLPKPSD